jgi:hypothetical protein
VVGQLRVVVVQARILQLLLLVEAGESTLELDSDLAHAYVDFAQSTQDRISGHRIPLMKSVVSD